MNFSMVPSMRIQLKQKSVNAYKIQGFVALFGRIVDSYCLKTKHTDQCYKIYN